MTPPPNMGRYSVAKRRRSWALRAHGVTSAAWCSEKKDQGVIDGVRDYNPIRMRTSWHYQMTFQGQDGTSFASMTLTVTYWTAGPSGLRKASPTYVSTVTRGRLDPPVTFRWWLLFPITQM
ncbi:MAG: hypothetical protein AMXMBFR61_17650 [Fimbriimonadales bacterium]